MDALREFWKEGGSSKVLKCESAKVEERESRCALCRMWDVECGMCDKIKNMGFTKYKAVCLYLKFASISFINLEKTADIPTTKFFILSGCSSSA